jgi:tetraacyldisaccharide-1-P 4'-kinase
MKMQWRSVFIGPLAAILVSTCIGLAAGGSHNSTDRKADVTFATSTKLNNGDTLPAGTYRMEIPENSQTPAVTFSKGGKVMATVEAKVVTGQKKSENTEIESVNHGDTQALTSIHPAGWDEEVVFASNGQDATQ